MRRLMLLSFSLLLVLVSFAQKTISGKITDAKSGSPLTGVSIKVKSSQKLAVTNESGVFKILAEPKDLLEISYVGYSSLTIKVGAITEFSIKLESATSDLGEVIMVGSRGAQPAPKQNLLFPLMLST